jgi:hypothetical protein
VLACEIGLEGMDEVMARDHLVSVINKASIILL